MICPLDQAADGYHAMDQRRAIKLLLRSKPRCFAGKAGRLALKPDGCWAG